MTAGLLYVTMQPKPSLSATQFHDWYNNEHGPLRLRLPFFPNGFRYRATDAEDNSPYSETKHEWVAFYDVTNSAEFVRPPYTTLRENTVKTEREAETMAQISVNRRMFDLIREWEAPDYKKLDDIDAQAKGHVLITVCFKIKPGTEEKLNKWYNEEHIDMLAKVPGWRRSRRFVTSSVLNPTDEEKEYLALHEYAPENGLDGPELKAATSSDMARDIYSTVVSGRVRRVYEWSYTFGPAPRDLHSLSVDPTYTAAFSSRDGLTKTWPVSQTPNKRAVIDSFVTTPDGVQLPFKLEGSPDPEAPLIVLVNSILSDWGIWDEFLDLFFAKPANQKFRVLRYRPRGRASDPGSTPITINLLSQDIVTILDALRVPKAASVIGVSLGGATTLNLALKEASRVQSFISCDTNSLAPPSNPTAWAERIALAENDPQAPTDPSTGARLVGEKLAEATARRWFVAESYDGGKQQARAERVKQFVFENHLEGFKKSVQALYSYDLRDAMKSGTVPGLFAVGAGDGVLPQGMQKMAEEYGVQGTRLAVVDGAGHLPMAEQPEKFVDVVEGFFREISL